MTPLKKTLAKAGAVLAALAVATVMFATASAAYPINTPGRIHVSPSHPFCGGKVSMSGSHFYPKSRVYLEAHGVVRETVRTDSKGRFHGRFRFGCAPGAKRVTFSAVGARGDTDHVTLRVRHYHRRHHH